MDESGIKDLEELPTSDILSNVQIDDFMWKDKEFESEISDETVGLAKETKRRCHSTVWTVTDCNTDAPSSPTLT